MNMENIRSVEKSMIEIFNDSFPSIMDDVGLTVQNTAEWLNKMNQSLNIGSGNQLLKSL